MSTPTNGSIPLATQLERRETVFGGTSEEMTDGGLESSTHSSKRFQYLMEECKILKIEGIPEHHTLVIKDQSLPKNLQNRKHYQHFDVDETEPHFKYSYGYMINGGLSTVQFGSTFIGIDDSVKKEQIHLSSEEVFDFSKYQIPKNILSHMVKDFVWRPVDRDVVGRDFGIFGELYTPLDRETKVVVSAQSIKFINGLVEPIWGSLFVYDVRAKQKVSATFNFMLNTEISEVGYIKDFPKHLIYSLAKRTALFAIPHDCNGLYWVVFFDKVFQPSTGIDNYLKKKVGEKSLQDKIAEAWGYLGIVRQPMCWSFEPVFESNDFKKPGQKFKLGVVQFTKLYTHVGDAKSRKKLYEIIPNPGDVHIKKAKLLLGEFYLDVSEASDERVVSMLGQKFEKERSQQDLKEYAHRLREKYNEVISYHRNYESPFLLHYHNSLMLHLKSAAFPNQYHNNVLIRITLRDTDDIKKIPPLRVIVSRMMRTNEEIKNLQHYAVSGSLYHQNRPEFFDEVRIDLTTAQFGKNHHLLFEFFHIKSSKPKLDKSVEEMSLNTVHKEAIGYSVVLLQTAGDVFLPDSDYKFHIYKDLPTNYLAKLDSLEPIAQKKTFKFTSKLISTVLPTDGYASKFLSRMPCYLEKEQSMELQDFFVQFLLPNATTATREFRLAAFDKLFPQLPVFLNLILFGISNMKEVREIGTGSQKEFTQLKEAATSAFYSLLVIARTCMDSGSKKRPAGRDHVLDLFTHFIFVNPARVCRPIYQAVCELWLEYLSSTGEESNRSLTSKTSTQKVLESKPTEKKRAVSIFGKVPFSSKNKTENLELKMPTTVRNNPTDLHKVEPKDTLLVAWFLFDIMAKSIGMYSQTPFLGSRIKHTWSYLDLQDDELFFSDTQLYRLISQLIKKGFEIGDMKWLRRINNNIATFCCDLLAVSFQKDMIETKFRTNTFKTLYFYLEQLENRNEERVVQKLKLDFVEVLMDRDNFLEMSLQLENNSLAKFVIDVLTDCFSSDFLEVVDGINVIFKVLTKWDHEKKFQSIEWRDRISSMFLPILDILENEDVFLALEKHLNEPKNREKLFHFSSVLFHLLINRDPKELKMWWLDKDGDFIVRLVNFFSLCIHTLAEQTPQTVKNPLRMTCVHLLKQIVEDFADRIPTEIQILDSLVNFMVVNIRWKDTKDGTVTNRETPDEEFQRNVFLPLFVSLLKKFITTIVANEKSGVWKVCIGIFLKHTEFPLISVNPDIKEGIKILSEPYNTQIENIEREKLVINEDSPDTIILQEDGYIKAALLDKLIERLTYDSITESEYQAIFLLTYRSFTNGFTLFTKLIQRYRQAILYDPEISDKICLRTLNVIKVWVENYFYDFDNILVTSLIGFLSEEIAINPKMTQFAKTLKKTMCMKLIDAEAKEELYRTIFSSNAPKPELPPKMKRLMEKEFSLLDWSSKEIARQLTMVEFDLFYKIEPKEMMSGSWAKKNKYRDAPNIVALTDRWNLITQWVSSTIMTNPDLKVRYKYVLKFIEVANELCELQNFHSLTALVAGLQAVAVHRLKKTWALIPEEKMQLYVTMSALVDSQGSYKEMRAKLKQCVTPLIPPLAMYLKDLTFVEDGNQDTLKTKNGIVLINYTKRRYVSKSIMSLRQYQRKYNLEVVHYLRDQILKRILDNTVFLTEDQQWENSLKFEPREK